MAEEGLVKLKLGDRTYYKHGDELTPYDAAARIVAERENTKPPELRFHALLSKGMREVRFERATMS